MKRITHNCPYCGDVLLRHARPGEVYWFCGSCRQEVSTLVSELSEQSEQQQLERSLRLTSRQFEKIPAMPLPTQPIP